MASITHSDDLFNQPSVWVHGPLIVGAGPSGLAVGACLTHQGVPFVILERSDCIASLWQKRTYNRLKLHLPKKFCQLPNLPFPSDFPEYPSRNQFISYLESYASHFDIHPRFNHAVQSARFDPATGMWHVRADVVGTGEVEYLCQWLVVATGENSENVVPEFVGMEEYCAGSPARAVHASEYKSGEPYHGKQVLVVGCGNTGMEVCLDLCHYHAFPSMVVRESVHVLPRDVFGMSVFAMAASLTRWLPLRVVDRILLAMARMVMGDVEEYGLKRPSVGPLELKDIEGKTPVLDIGALEKIRSGEIKVVPGIKRFSAGKVELVDGRIIDVDAVILATGYRSNVPSWLQGCDFFSRDGYPKVPFPNGWKGKSGLYAVGFTKRGLSGASMDAVRIAEDIGIVWREVTMLTGCHRRCTSEI